MIVNSGGILIDWDLSRLRRSMDNRTAARRYSHTVSKSYETVWPLMSDIYSHQGTWQFMAALLVKAPDIPHTPIYDLESAFWVLMWVALTYTQTNWSVGLRSSFIKETMNPRVFMGSRGTNKLSFMESRFSLLTFAIDNNPQLTRLVRDLKSIFTIYHEARALAEANGSRQIQVDDPEAALTNHQEVLNLFNTVLKSTDWPDNDKAQRQCIVVSNDVQISMHSSSKRSREVAEESGVYLLPPPAKRLGTA